MNRTDDRRRLNSSKETSKSRDSSGGSFGGAPRATHLVLPVYLWEGFYREPSPYDVQMLPKQAWDPSAAFFGVPEIKAKNMPKAKPNRAPKRVQKRIARFT